jgi:hypothetical protein
MNETTVGWVLRCDKQQNDQGGVGKDARWELEVIGTREEFGRGLIVGGGWDARPGFDALR